MITSLTSNVAITDKERTPKINQRRKIISSRID